MVRGLIGYVMASERARDRERKHTLKAPINPNTESTFAKCKYHPKFRARWNGSSGS